MNGEIQLWKEEPEPEWSALLFTLARDHRHNLLPDVIELWKQKLKPYPAAIVIRALSNGEWEHFPSTNEVIKEIKLMQEKARQDAINRDYERYQAQQKLAQEQGLLASDEDYAKMNDQILEIVGRGKENKPKKVYYAPSSTAPSKEELNRRREEQLKAVYEKYGPKK